MFKDLHKERIGIFLLSFFFVRKYYNNRCAVQFKGIVQLLLV
nr:MAG TPA: hypothetical protein [Caudoviricetes sp.]